MVTGVCPDMRFVMLQKGTNAAITVIANSDTQYLNVTCGTVSGALQVSVTGVLLSTGTYVATVIQGQDHVGG